MTLHRFLPLFLALGLALGCGGSNSDPEPNGGDKGKSDPAAGDSGKGDVAIPKGQSFKEAALLDPPDGELPPPDLTLAGKNTGKLHQLIAGKDGKGGLWDRVAFTTADGKKLRHFALVKTDLGDIKIELFSDEAPRHVRNFVALARAGYYDGLNFHRTARNETDDGKLFHYLEAGCPKGNGEAGYGSIGYWLLPEFNEKLTHAPGTVGAWHGIEVESAACRFYVTLAPAPWMDGHYTIFGRIVAGLEVAAAINQRPLREDKLGPLEPVIMRSVVIEEKVLE